MRHTIQLIALATALAAAPAGAQETPAPNGLLEGLLAPAAPEPVALPGEPAGKGPEPAAGQAPEEPLEEALATYRSTGEAPAVAEPGRTVVPFGHRVPELVCVPGRACDVELEAGEVIDGLVLGDPEGWSVAELAEGGEELTPHVLVKPARHETTTNLVIVTDRRTYHLELASPPEPEGDNALDYRHLAFWYPDAWVRRLRDEAARRAAESQEEEPVEALEGVAPGELSFAWELDRPWRKRHRLPWEPVTVFDDGRRTYVKLPAASRVGPLPALVGRRPDGTTFPVNARLDGDLYVVPAVLPELELVIGSGGERRWLRLVRAADGGRR